MSVLSLLAPICRSAPGSIMAITNRIHYADHAPAPICRSRSGSNMPIADINRLRGLLTEFGVVAPLSPDKLRRELARCQDPEDRRLPPTLRQIVSDQVTALDALDKRLAGYAEQIATQARGSEVAKRLQTLVG